MAFVIDVFSRRIVGWKAVRTMHTPLVLNALNMAARSRRSLSLNGLVYVTVMPGDVSSPDTWPEAPVPAIAVTAGLPRIRLHDVRHTYASVFLQAGVPLKVVSERIGHAQATATLNLYAHVLPGADAGAAVLGASVIRGAVEK